MGQIDDPRFAGIDFERSYLLGVIYDDESLTLEMDFRLAEQHPSYNVPAPGAEGCYKSGYVRFAEIDDLQIDKAPVQDGETIDYSIVHSVAGGGERFEFSTGWGDIKLSAGSIRIAFD